LRSGSAQLLRRGRPVVRARIILLALHNTQLKLDVWLGAQTHAVRLKALDKRVDSSKRGLNKLYDCLERTLAKVDALSAVSKIQICANEGWCESVCNAAILW
jgi:hypothetical protein